jgi:hypothetical protein
MVLLFSIPLYYPTTDNHIQIIADEGVWSIIKHYICCGCSKYDRLDVYLLEIY